MPKDTTLYPVSAVRHPIRGHYRRLGTPLQPSPCTRPGTWLADFLPRTTPGPITRPSLHSSYALEDRLASRHRCSGEFERGGSIFLVGSVTTAALLLNKRGLDSTITMRADERVGLRRRGTMAKLALLRPEIGVVNEGPYNEERLG